MGEEDVLFSNKNSFFLLSSNKLNIESVGWVCALFFAFLAFINYSLSEKFLFISGSIGLLLLIQRKGINNALIWFLLVGVVIQVLSWIGLKVDGLYPEMSGPRIYRLTRPVLVLTLLVYLIGNRERSKSFFLCMTMGLLYTLFLRAGSIWQWEVAFNGGRSDWGVRSIADISLFSSISLLYLMFIYIPTTSGGYIYRRFFGAFLVVLHIILIILGQMRGIWLALFISMLFSFVFMAFNRSKESLKKWIIIFLSGFIIMISLLSLPNVGNIVKKRLSDEQDIILSMARGDWGNLPLTSIGLRVHMWRDAIGYINERPILGWHYPDLRKIKISEAKYSHIRYPRSFSHFHNGYLDIFFLYGFLGFSFIGIFACYIFYNVLRMFRSGDLPQNYFLFGCSSFVVFFVGNLTDPYVTYPSGMLVIMLVVLVLWDKFADLFFTE